MRLIVDEIPKKPGECLYARHSELFGYICNLSGAVCALSRYKPCDRLRGLNTNITISFDDGK